MQKKNNIFHPTVLAAKNVKKIKNVFFGVA
jgi:hypothetical protein